MMSRIRGKNTRPEMAVRRYLHGQGFRYRLHVRDLPGKPDIVLPRFKSVVFVNGCFWHRHDGCPKAYTPKSNVEFWETKFAGNVARDRRNQRSLEQAGWRVFIIWECEINEDTLDYLAMAIRSES